MNERQQAQNPKTPPEVLQELARSSDMEVRAAVAKNPNTPTDVLMELGADFPKQLLENPAFSLLQLENPNLPALMPSKTVQSLIKQEEVPQSFLEVALEHLNKSALLLLAIHPQTPLPILKTLAKREYSKDTNRVVRDAARLNLQNRNK